MTTLKRYRYYLQPLKSASTAAAPKPAVSPKDRTKEDQANKLTAEQKIIEAEERREAARVAREFSRKEAEEQAKEKIVNSVAVPLQYSSSSSSSFANQDAWLAQAPEGVPSILSWTQRDDGASCEMEMRIGILVSFLSMYWRTVIVCLVAFGHLNVGASLNFVPLPVSLVHSILNLFVGFLTNTQIS